MSVNAVAPIPPQVGELQATFSALQSPTSSDGTVGEPVNPFSVLLEAASSPQNAPSSPMSMPANSSLMSELAGLQTTAGDGVLGANSGSPDGTAVVADAEQYLGVPYQWGGTNPTSGLDCSGLVQRVYGDLGISLPRTSQEQSQVGTPVPDLADAVPGDLLFFEPGANGPGHVGIYFGNGEMIDAPQTGETVQIQQVPTDALVGIRRVIDPSSNSLAVNPTGDGVPMGNVTVPTNDAGLVEQSAQAFGVPAPILASVLSTESGFSPTAVSSAGAEGIAQFLPSTAAGIGINPFDPTQAIPAAAQLLASYHNQFGSWPLALAAYNAGPGSISPNAPVNPSVANYVSTVLGKAGT